MDKISLKLSLEDLSVESFDTGAPGLRRGTVRAYGTQELETCDFTCPGGTYDPERTCNIYCQPNQSVGLSACCYSRECTGNPHDFQCINSENFCFETQQAGCSYDC